MNGVARYDGDGRDWDAFVARSAQGSFCHLFAWQDIMRDVLGHHCTYWAAHAADGTLQGVLPLVRVRAPLLGRYLVSMPFLNDGGPLGDDATRMVLAARARQQAESERADLLELRTRHAVPQWACVSHRKITVQLPLPDSGHALWQRFPSKLRSQVRRPQKEGYVTRFGLDERGAFYDVFSRNMRALGTPVLPRALFDRIAREFPALVEFGVVYAGDVPIAAGCGFSWQGEFEITWASSLREYNRASPNMLLYWAFLERLAERGMHTFDFGRCTPGGTTHRFKQQWGGHDLPLPWAQWSSRGVAAPPTPDRPAFQLATACWRRLPLAVTNRLGPVIARRLP
ncbi:MAG TPA: FemAB family XrtA/PEP-CTERM system-associated protein [Gemmatimonadaceae bacterium]|nr:FemAB family XrtA/PEP-CTERM system-associated protein [Gemmatimonadaceae bacterium]